LMCVNDVCVIMDWMENGWKMDWWKVDWVDVESGAVPDLTLI